MMDPKQRIEESLKREGLVAKEWREDEDDGVTAVIGRFQVIEDDEDRGLYAEDEGELSACVVGAAEYSNERVCFSFVTDGYGEGNEVRDLSLLEAI